ncbi:hypothetical protein M422DRAFT_65282 [Sphaerobolus stellatus SS14]|nr:hypothetical protein M422DRAFT_65282 [Sphaerobolus stellatus SS14]
MAFSFLPLSPKRLFLVLLTLSLIFIVYTNYGLLDPLFSYVAPSSRTNHAVTTPTPRPNAGPLPNDLPGEQNTRVLLVSAFFPLDGTTYTFQEYKPRLELFLSRITTDVYFFTTPEYEPIIRKIRGDMPIAINTTFATPFDIPPLQNRRRDYQRMQSLDRETGNRSIDFYAYMNAKPYFLYEGLEIARRKRKPGIGQGYRWAFWVDPGTFKEEHSYRRWPDPNRLDVVWDEGMVETSIGAKDIFFIPLLGLPNPSMSMWNEALGPIQRPIITDTSFYGGSPEIIAWWYHIYYAYHDYWLRKAGFVGSDKGVVNGLSILFSFRIVGVWLEDPLAPAARTILASEGFKSRYNKANRPPRYLLDTPLGQCLDHSGYHVYFLASYDERKDMVDMWLQKSQHLWPWQWIKQIGVPKIPCTLTRVVGLESLFRQRAFGKGWDIPRASQG